MWLASIFRKLSMHGRQPPGRSHCKRYPLQTSSIHQVVVTRHPPRNKVLSEHLFYARASKDRRRSPPTNETLYSFLRAPPVSDVDINKPTTRQTDPTKTKYMAKKKSRVNLTRCRRGRWDGRSFRGRRRLCTRRHRGGGASGRGNKEGGLRQGTRKARSGYSAVFQT